MIRRGVVFAIGVVVSVVGAACALVPISDVPAPPQPTHYLGPHGRPRAFGGGVCPLQGRHDHVYPAVPRAAFVDVDGAAKDTRRFVAFKGPHPWLHGRCSLSTWHQHVAPANPTENP
jgi:hypothetical protein